MGCVTEERWVKVKKLHADPNLLRRCYITLRHFRKCIANTISRETDRKNDPCKRHMCQFVMLVNCTLSLIFKNVIKKKDIEKIVVEIRED